MRTSIILISTLALAILSLPAVAEPELGRELYQRHCQTCHGPQGLGDGPTAEFLPVAPRNLTVRPYRFGCGTGAVAGTVSRGIKESGMPAFEKTLTQSEIWELARYVTGLQAGCCGP